MGRRAVRLLKPIGGYNLWGSREAVRTIGWTMRSPDWMRQAACHDRNMHPDWVGSAEPNDALTHGHRVALALCARCPVADECLSHALAEQERWGIWGGTTEQDRAPILKRLRTGVLTVPDAASILRGKSLTRARKLGLFREGR